MRKVEISDWGHEIISFSDDGTLLIASNKKDRINVFDAASGKLVVSYETKFTITCFTHIPHTNKVAIGIGDGMLYIWDYVNNESRKIKAHKWEITAIASDALGNNLVTISEDQSIKIWGQKDLCLEKTIKEKNARLLYMPTLISSSNKLISMFAQNIGVWDLIIGKSICDFYYDKSDHQLMGTYCLSNDQKILVTGSREGRICAWETSSLRQIYELDKKIPYVHNIAIDSKDLFAAAGSYDGDLATWNLTTGKLVAELHTDKAVKFSAFTRGTPPIVIAGFEDTLHFLSLDGLD